MDFMKKITVGLVVSMLAGVLSVSVVKAGTNLPLTDLSSGSGKNKTEQPNVLLIMTDQQTADAMSNAGNRYLNTPAMDELAADGIRFTNNYVTQPLCMPFRTSLQTARYPHEVKVRNNGEEIAGDFPLLGNLMADAGYTLNYVGKWHVGTTPENAGYDKFEKGGTDKERADLAEKFLLQNHERPFFLTVSMVNPHDVCQLARADAVGTDLPDGSIGMAPTISDELPPLPANFNMPENEPSVIREVQDRSASFHYPTANWNELTWRQYLWGYYRLVEKVDTEIGRVLQALEDGGHKDNTIVIFTSDHGEGVAMHHWNQKQILYDQATKTPFIINWNGRTKHSIYSNLVTNALDIPATLLDLAGAKKPESMRGTSLLPLIYGTPIEKYDYVVSETMFARGSTNLGATGRMIRTERYKYIIYDNGEKREQLFDMRNDSGEMNNLVYEKEFSKVLVEHRELIEKWAKETNDIGFPYHNL
jgi:choline-sulfatase